MFYVVLALAIVLASFVLGFIFHRMKLSVLAGFAAFLAWSLLCSVTVIGNDYIAVEKHFGKTVESSYGPGLHFFAPWVSLQRFVALRREFQFEGDVITADNNPLTVSVGFATKLNPSLAWRVLQVIGPNYFTDLVVKAGQTAVRDGIASFPWTKAVTSDRGEVQRAIQANFERILNEQLVANGLTEQEAKAALEVSPVQMRSALPDKKVLNAVAERSASEQDLQRQKTLTKIAEEEANRRKNEGDGVANLFSQLPKGFTSDEIAQVLGALADKTRADAMLKAVESGQVKTVIMNGDTAGNVSHVAEPVEARVPEKAD